MYLSELQNNESAIILKVRGRGAFRKRIMEMGFVRGKEITVIRNAPLDDPIEYSVMNYKVSLRRGEAKLIEIIPKADYSRDDQQPFNNIVVNKEKNQQFNEKGKTINIALVGNPNCGKTTLYNYSSGSREHVANYGGVTIDSKEATFQYGDYIFNITDLPGTYSLSAYSPEELFVRKHIIENIPDVIVNVLDSSNLERNLYLTTQLIDMDLKVVAGLNIYDELIKRGDRLDYTELGSMIGIPMVPTVGIKGKGLNYLYNTIIDVFNDREANQRHIHINYGSELETSITKIQNKIKIKVNSDLLNLYSSRFLAIKLLEKDRVVTETIELLTNQADIIDSARKEIRRLESLFNDDTEAIITDCRYGFINGALKETYHAARIKTDTIAEKIDSFLIHKYFGFPVFLFFMFLMFQCTFVIGKYPMQWIDYAIRLLETWLNNLFPEGALKHLIVDGVIGGIGGVIVFLPNILILFLFISIMEDTGYMARAAFIMDRIMHKIGLHGKSFIPLIMGFGCNVPAIMATRTIENKNSRLITMLINPFMSCSARLPVYILIISAFFPTHAGLVLFSIYLTGIVMASVIAILFRKTIFREKETPFVMELPPYRVPTVISTVRHLWHKGSQYLQRIGGVILVSSIIIWALSFYPNHLKYSKNYNTLSSNTINDYNKKITIINPKDTSQIIQLTKIKDSVILILKQAQSAEHHQYSYIGKIGKHIEPILRPLGFDWKMSISVLMGISSKEIVVSTIGVLEQAGDSKNISNLTQKLREETYSYGENKGKKVYTTPAALAFMFFILMYSPCIAVIMVIKKESGSWRWALFSVLYSTSLAYLVAFCIYQIGNLII